MKKAILLASAVSLALLTSCKKDSVTPAADNNAVVNDTAVTAVETTPKESEGGKVTGLTCDNGYEINVHWPKTEPADSVAADVVKEGKSELLKMARVQSGSGAKFESADGKFLWNQGKEYQLGQGEKTLCTCTEK